MEAHVEGLVPPAPPGTGPMRGKSTSTERTGPYGGGRVPRGKDKDKEKDTEADKEGGPKAESDPLTASPDGEEMAP